MLVCSLGVVAKGGLEAGLAVDKSLA